ncbi:DUF3747 domain-containing protein [Pantanalinema sp. GBBB05]|uniref:DUF3747 domain-containing protein n=1 Tax=Pantanalinema sp. GBBB05 TaxID=2604139 RepID=UPI001DA79FCE|nr:DUF3747 domain-containing protein [Pantanalinema sp. GBBB05]
MNLASRLRLAALTTLGLCVQTIASPVHAAQFSQGEVNQNRLIAIAAPIGSGASHQLLVLEQLNNSRSCWQEKGANPTQVDPLLLNFDFTNICSRSTDSNGYSVRVGNQDLGWRYSLRIVKQQGNMVLMAVPNTDRNQPPLEIGKTNGMTNGFAKITLNPGWRFTRRVYNGQTVGHVYLTNDQPLVNLSAIAAATRPTSSLSTLPTTSQPVAQPLQGSQPSRPTKPNPVVSSQSPSLPPSRPTAQPVVPPAPRPIAAPGQNSIVVPTIPASSAVPVDASVLAPQPSTQTSQSSSSPLVAALPTNQSGSAIGYLPPLDSAAPSNLPALTAAATVSQRYSLWSTYYYVHRAQHTPNGQPLLDISGNDLGVRLSSRDWCGAAVEGTVQVIHNQQIVGTYNYAGRGSREQVDCSPYYSGLKDIRATNQVRFRPTSNPYGDGVSGLRLVPYRTIAVDRSLIPIGSVIYIPAARGTVVTLPSGQRVTHDGYFYAADVGGAINGNHIDIFLGVAEQNPFRFVTSSPKGTFEAYLVNDPQIQQTLAALHRSGRSVALQSK